MIKRGTTISVDEKIAKTFTPLNPIQTKVTFKIYYTEKYDANYCDEDGMMLLGKLTVYVTRTRFGTLDPLSFGFAFGQTEITITATNEINGQKYSTRFELDIQ